MPGSRAQRLADTRNETRLRLSGGRRLRSVCLALGVSLVALGAASPAQALVGDLTQLPGTLGCLEIPSYRPLPPTCQLGRFPGGPVAVDVSPDGRNAYVLANGSWSGGGGVGIYDRNPSGVLTQKAGTAGCMTTTGSPGEDGVNRCAVGRHIDVYRRLAVSPDGRNVYVAGDGVAILKRDTTTGALTQRDGPEGCITSDGSPGEDEANTCGVGPALGGESEVAFSPDGGNVYVAAGDGVAVFARDASSGALVQTSCISTSGSPGADGANTCVDGRALAGVSSVAVAPDARNVYVASGGGGGAVVALERDTSTGALTQKAGTDGCTSQNGGPLEDPCADGKALSGASSVTVSPDGRSVYVASAGSSAVAIFDRDTTTGVLTQKAGRAGCVSQNGSPSGNPTVYYCRDAGVLDGAAFVRVSPDGESVYVAYGSGDPGSAVAWFDRNRATGDLAAGGCISDGGTGGRCTVGAWAMGGFVGAMAVSPDGGNVYATGRDIGPEGFVLVFARELDLLAPETTISSGPAADSSTRDGSATFAFSSSEPGSTFACSVDGGALTSCSSPFTTSLLRAGRHTFVVQSTDSAGNVDTSPASRGFTVTDSPAPTPPSRTPAAGGPGPVADTAPPIVSRYGLTHNPFRVGGASTPSFARTAALRPERGTTIRFTLSETAKVRLVISRLGIGRRSGTRCVAPTRALRRAKACTRIIWKGTLTRTGRRGANRVAFSGRMRSTALKPGRYQAALTATDSAQNSSQRHVVNFKIVAR